LAIRTNPGLPSEPSEIPTDFTSLAKRELQTLRVRMQLNKRLIIGLSFGVCGFCAAAWSGSAPGGSRMLARKGLRPKLVHKKSDCASAFLRIVSFLVFSLNRDAKRDGLECKILMITR
jgi:hypothetical protein